MDFGEEGVLSRYSCWLTTNAGFSDIAPPISVRFLLWPLHVVSFSVRIQHDPIWFKFLVYQNQTVNDRVAHSKNPRKCAYHVTFDLDLEHTLDAC